MTAKEVIRKVADRALDDTQTDYSPDRLRTCYWTALDSLNKLLATHHIEEVGETYFRRMARGAQSFNFDYHGIPQRVPHRVRIAYLLGRYVLTQVPENNSEGVQVYFDRPVQLTEPMAYISGEKRQPVVNGERGLTLSEDLMSATLPDLRGSANPATSDLPENAGYLYVKQSGWVDVTFDRNSPMVQDVRARFQGSEIIFEQPATQDMLVQVSTRGFDPSNYTADDAPVPVPEAEQYLCSHTLRLALTDRAGDGPVPPERVREAEQARVDLLNLFIQRKQAMAGRPRYPISAPSRQLRLWSW